MYKYKKEENKCCFTCKRGRALPEGKCGYAYKCKNFEMYEPVYNKEDICFEMCSRYSRV